MNSRFYAFGIAVLLVGIGFNALLDDAIQKKSLRIQQQKTQYMQLCADEGISAFNCLNNWMGVQP